MRKKLVCIDQEFNVLELKSEAYLKLFDMRLALTRRISSRAVGVVLKFQNLISEDLLKRKGE